MNLCHHQATELHAIDLWLIGSDDICVFNPMVREEKAVASWRVAFYIYHTHG